MARTRQGNDQPSIGEIYPSGRRYLSATVIILFLLLLLAGALATPFFFESPTMWYKFGIEKAGLRTGKMLGLAAGLLLLIQLPLAGRLKILDRIFSLPGLIRQHRIHAWAIVLLSLIHPVCVLVPEGTILLPIEARYWPEWVGAGLLAGILIQFACSRWRQQSGLAGCLSCIQGFPCTVWQSYCSFYFYPDSRSRPGAVRHFHRKPFAFQQDFASGSSSIMSPMPVR